MPSTRRRRVQPDPFRDYTFRILIDGHPLADVAHVSALQRTTDVVDYREGTGAAQVRHLPGLTNYTSITLKRGFVADDSLWTWARQVGEGTTPSALRKELRIEVLNRRGQLAVAYNLHHCWPSAYAAFTELETGRLRRLVQSITLECEDWDREIPTPPRAGRRRPTR